MNPIKLKLKNIYNIYCIPALWIHELSHAFISTLFLKRVIDIYVMVNKEQGAIYGGSALSSTYRNIVEEIFICMAPLIFMATFLLLSFFYPYFFILSLYQLSTLSISLPSKGDFKFLTN